MVLRLACAVVCVGATLAASPSRASGEGRPELECLSSGDALEIVSTHQVVAPARAILVARAAAPGAEILRASLCRQAGVLLYLVMGLRKDGRLVRVTVDAGAGKVLTVH